MVKNIIWFILFVLSSLLTGCAGVMPAVPYDEFKSKNTPIPEGVRNNSSVGGASGGVEVREFEDRYGGGLSITPFFGDKSVEYNRGRRDAKAYLRQMKQSAEIERAIEKGFVDAERGVFEPVGFNLRYLEYYEEAFDREREMILYQNSADLGDSEYNQGWNDIFEKAGIKPTQ